MMLRGKKSGGKRKEVIVRGETALREMFVFIEKLLIVVQRQKTKQRKEKRRK